MSHLIDKVAGPAHVDEEVLGRGIQALDKQVAAWLNVVRESRLSPFSQAAALEGNDGSYVVVAESSSVPGAPGITNEKAWHYL